MTRQTTEPFNVLIIDDERGDVELIRSAIREGRYRCNIADVPDGIEGLAYLRRNSPVYQDAPTPHLVLLDLNMPRKNGREVLAEVKSDRSLARIPIVILTTSDAERDVAQSYDLGASGFVTKPVDIDELFEAIHGIQDYWFGTVQSPVRTMN